MFLTPRLLAPLASFLLLLLLATTVVAQQPQPKKDFPAGAARRMEDLPPGRFRSALERLPAPARGRALQWLAGFHFTEGDLDHLQADSEGGIFYADTFTLAPADAGDPLADSTPVVAGAAVPVNQLPSNLLLHSKPGAPNIIFLNFSGESVSGTAWNTSLGRTVIAAVAFSSDADFTTFSDAEQLAIKRIWQRVAEDFAPFNVDVTTERPATFTTRTAHALITRNTDANGAGNPSMDGGGVAYVNVFGSANFSTYRPAWIYYNNLGSDESYIAEATSHEVGHNLGLSHDGTSSQSYYGGHGSDETSWGPIMGTGYDRNVSQWSKGEYNQANNAEDDLAIISGKMPYRADDIGNTLAAAGALTVAANGAVVATTLENDPAGTNRANKGVIERNTDIDVFSFATGTGLVDLAVNPWINPSGRSHGGNLDLIVELYDSAGTRLLTNNASNLTRARIQTNLSEGVYYLAVRNTGVGSPLAVSPTGYTSYGSIGQYFVTGTVVASSMVIPPAAALTATDIFQPSVPAHLLTVTFTDNSAVDVSTIGSGDLTITGPNGYVRSAPLVSVDSADNGTPRVAVYSAPPPNGSEWLPTDAGSYSVSIVTNAVRDTEGASVPAGVLGQFSVAVPRLLFAATLDTSSGWSLDPLWEFGLPAYPAGIGPSAGFTGSNILACNLAGDYPNRQPMAYATSPSFSCIGVANVSLRFQRWLRLRSGDTAVIEASVNGGAWTNVWSTTSVVADATWQTAYHSLPSYVAGASSVRLRWGLESNPSQTDIGWNIDDVQVVGTGTSSNAQLTVSANNLNWGGISTTGGTYAAGASIAVTAVPSNYFRFVGWGGAVQSTNNPLSLVLETNMMLEAHFAEMVTAQGTPWWWLAAFGFTNVTPAAMHAAASGVGANGMPRWQSFVAGLNPNDPASQLRLWLQEAAAGNTVLHWDTVTGRVYTVHCSTNLAAGFAPLPSASELPATVHSFTNTAVTTPGGFYRLEVRMR